MQKNTGKKLEIKKKKIGVQNDTSAEQRNVGCFENEYKKAESFIAKTA